MRDHPSSSHHIYPLLGKQENCYCCAIIKPSYKAHLVDEGDKLVIQSLDLLLLLRPHLLDLRVQLYVKGWGATDSC